MSVVLYESKLSARRWIACDLPGNAGWIIWVVCLILLLKKGITWYSVLAIIPAILMLIGVIELISERIRKLDWVLPKARLYRGFGSLTLGGILGIPIAAVGLITFQDPLCWWMLAGACLCALFAWLIFREYHPQKQGGGRS
ncbi:MAG: hypothetical protein IKP40_10510 [Clostridia bacterium]|nr:hypothetical protein [Clostridia bacterium]